MPHLRTRYATSLIKKLLKFSPVVGIVGQRQVGKTTLTEQLASEYSTMDQATTLAAAEDNPDGFIANRPAPFAIDECQAVASLFTSIKDHVRRFPKPGQFLLTGSVRFTSLENIRESLTGRIVYQEILPLSLAECHSRSLPAIATQLLITKKMPSQGSLTTRTLEARRREMSDFLSMGGLPGICFIRDPVIRQQKFENHIKTVIDRDLRIVCPTRIPYRTLRSVLSFLAVVQGAPLDISEVSRSTRVSPPTLRKLLDAFESLFLLRIFDSLPEKRPVLFFEDQGMVSHLIGRPLDRNQDLTRGLFANIFSQFHYRQDLPFDFFQYRTRGGALVPLIFRSPAGTLGLIPISEDRATASCIKSALSLCRTFKNAIAVVAHEGTQVEWLHPRVLSLPWPFLM